MGTKENLLGKKFSTSMYGDFVVIGADRWDKMRVKFVSTGYECITRTNHIKDGVVKDPTYPIVFGFGYFGTGKYSSKTHKKAYMAWYNMIIRCHDESYQRMYPTYKKCTISDEWRNFQLFAEWYEIHRKPFVKETPCLDKDIINKGNKIYSPENCCLVPAEINNAIIKADAVRSSVCLGVKKGCNRYYAHMSRNNRSDIIGRFDTEEEAFLFYKKEKESYIKSLAEKHKHIIKPDAYIALINYQVEYETSSWINE